MSFESSWHRFAVRRLDMGPLLDLFLISAVSCLLGIRLFLKLTGYPQLGNSSLHIAHMLWGGLGMLLAIILFIALPVRTATQFAAFIGGLGFGAFIDELGKFITADNDYFFQPVIAIIYLIFVGLFFLFHWLGTVRNLTEQTALVNAFDYAKEAVLRNMDAGERDEALYLLSRADQRDPLVVSLTETLRAYTDLVQPLPSPVAKVKGWLNRRYASLLRRRVFKVVMVGWFVVVAMADLIVFVPVLLAGEAITFATLGLALSGALSGALVAVGVIRWHRSHLHAYRWFERAVLVAIFFGCFFSFYQDQLGALWNLLLLLITWATIRYIIGQELKREAGELAAAQTSGGDHGTPQVLAEGGD